MSLQQLRCFCAAAELGSFSAAADALRVSQPAVAEQVRKLEQALGAALFVRAARGVHPTEAGHAFAAHAMRTLRALEEALLAFGGCAVVISHDRWFLDRVATHVLAFEGDSQVRWFEGNFEAYEEHRRALLGDEADRPHRITYKRLTRT